MLRNETDIKYIDFENHRYILYICINASFMKSNN